jgi:hypothetical protein
MSSVAGEAPNCARRAFMCSTAMGCPAALDLADVVTSICFAAIGPLFGRCFATESVWTHFLVDALPPWSLGSLADALPP